MNDAILPQQFVFDHDGADLAELAMGLGLHPVPTDKTGDAKDFQAEEWLEESNWQLAFVHMNEKPWRKLCESAPADRVLVRFSKPGFSASRPEGARALCLRCSKRIPDLVQADIEALKSVLTDERSLQSIREGLVPKGIWHLISFTEPSRLQALYIVTQGVMATWASAPADPCWKETMECLGVTWAGALHSRGSVKRAAIWKALRLQGDSAVTVQSANDFHAGLAHELGLETLDDEAEIRDLVKAVCEGKADGGLDNTVVLQGYKAMKKILLRA